MGFHRRNIGLGLLAILIGLLGQPAPARPETRRVTDALGREVVLELPVRRVVALNSDAIEVLRSLKADQLLVGVYSQISREPAFWGPLAALPKVGSWRDPEVEAIARLQPDLVIGYGKNPGPVFERKARAVGIQVLRLDLYRLATLEREVRLLGDLLDRSGQAEAFCAWYQGYLAMIRTRLATKTPRRPVYLESYSDYHAAGPLSGAHDMCLLAGGRNIAEEMAIAYPQVTPEWVVDRNPEVIFKAATYTDGYGAADASALNRRRDAIMQRPAWQYIDAVAAGRVYVMDSAIWTGPRAVVGVAYMARWLYPERFGDLDPRALHQEYLERFQGIAYRGFFVSDPGTKPSTRDGRRD